MFRRLTIATLAGVALALMFGGPLSADEPRRGPKERPDGPPRIEGDRRPDQPPPERALPREGRRPAERPDRPGPRGDRRPGPRDGQPGPPEGRPGPRDGQPGPPEGRPGPRDGRPGPREGDRPGPPDGRPGDPHAGPEHPDGPPRWPHHDWEAIEREDPEMFKLLKADHDLERETRELAMQFRMAPSDERETIKKRVEELVNKHFEVRQERRELELKRLEKELERLRDAIEQRNEARDTLVKKRVAHLLGEDHIDF